jgi:hypothetical protein
MGPGLALRAIREWVDRKRRYPTRFDRNALKTRGTRTINPTG